MKSNLMRLILAVAWLAAGWPAAPARAQVAPADDMLLYMPLLSQDSGAYAAGLYVPLVTYAGWPGEVNAAIALTGKTHGLYLVSAGFNCKWVDNVTKLRQQLDVVHAKGAMSLITWMPTDCSNGGFGDVTKLSLQDILNGAWDTYLAQWATDLAALGYPVMVRWGHEMNIPSYSWAGQNAFGANGETKWNAVPAGDCGGQVLTGCYGDPTVVDGPERFIAAYRYVHDRVAPTATNVIWVWNPNGRDWLDGADEASQPAWNHFTSYYPGDAYVDWVGPDGYNWGAESGNGGTPYTWDTFDALFNGPLTEMAALYPAKPQVIPEFASVEDKYDPNRKAAWLVDAYSAARKYPLLRAMIYVHDPSFMDAFYYPSAAPATFQIDSSTAASAAYKQAVAGWSSRPPQP
ncbi:MAG: hypothetical protein KA764_07480 [Anaerolineales bacterium]|nr:hypothetical protein [Anaerolineales bacterium]